MSGFFKFFQNHFSGNPNDFKNKKYALDDSLHNYSEEIESKTIQYACTLILKRVTTDNTTSYSIKYPDNNIFSGVKFSKDDKCVITNIFMISKSSTLPCDSAIKIVLKSENKEDYTNVIVKLAANEETHSRRDQLYGSKLPGFQIQKLIGRKCFLEYLPTDTFDLPDPSSSGTTALSKPEQRFFPNPWVVKKSTFWPTVLYMHGGALKLKYSKVNDGAKLDFNLYKVKQDVSMCTISNSIIKILKTEMEDKYFSKMDYLQIPQNGGEKMISLQFDKSDDRNKLTNDVYVCKVVLEIKYVSANLKDLKLLNHKFQKISCSRYL